MAKIPTRLEELLPLGAYEKVVDLLQRPDLSGRLREALNKVGLKELNPLEQVQDAWQQAKTWLGSLTEDNKHSSGHWINATGEMFPLSIDRAPMIPSVSLSWARLNSGFQDRTEHTRRADEVLQRIFGSRSTAFFADPLSALQTVTRTLGKSVFIARCDCVRIPGFGDVRAMLAAYGNEVREVGATNGATESDWTVALTGGSSQTIVLVSPSAVTREQRETHRTAALGAAKKHGAKVVELLVDGSLNRKLSQSLGCPNPIDRLDQGADFVLLPTHFFCGGPRGVLCVGDPQWIANFQAHASVVSAELDCAGIAANLLALQLACLEDEVDSGLIGALLANPDNLRNRCQRLAVQIQGVGPIKSAQVADSQHSLGASPWDSYQLQNPVIAVQSDADLQALYIFLKTGSGDRQGIHLRRHGSSLHIDLRFVHPEDDHQIVAAIRQYNQAP